MSLSRVLKQEVTVLDPSLTSDAEGNSYGTWADGATYKGWLEQMKGTERNSPPDALIGSWLLVLPPDAVLTGRSRVRADGVTYEVDGPPSVKRTPRGPHHIEAVLKAVDV